MPNNWKTYKLGELYNSASGLSKSRDEFGFGNPFVTFKNVFYNYFLPNELTELANTNEKEVHRSSVLKGDFFLTRTSETLHELGMSSVALKDYPLATFNGFCKRLRLKKDIDVQIDPVFMGFYLRSSKFRSEVSKHSTMTTRASLNNDSIASLEIDLPPYHEQVQIGEILKSLLDKIELNLQMNKTMEEMAMTLYKHWFVDFEPFKEGKFVDSELGLIPEGWEVNDFETLVDIKGGKRLPKGAQLSGAKNSHPYIRVRDFGHTYLSELGMEYVPDDVFPSISRYITNTNDVIMSIVGTIGEVAIVGENLDNASLTENCVKMVLKDKRITSELIYLYLTSFVGINELKSRTVGSTQPKLPIYNVKSLTIPLPKEKVQIENPLDEITRIHKLIFNNFQENQTLTALRDTLLPKLISGEVRVKDIEKQVAEVL